MCRKLRSRMQRLLSRWILASPFFGLNETLLFRPWPIQNIYLCLSYCYINVSSFIHSGTTNSVNAVCFKAFMHESNSNLCSTACWWLCNSLQHFLDRQIMDEVSRIWHSFFPQYIRIKNEQILLFFQYLCANTLSFCLQNIMWL